MDVLSPFVLCHSDWLFHGESCPRLDVVHPCRPCVVFLAGVHLALFLALCRSPGLHLLTPQRGLHYCLSLLTQPLWPALLRCTGIYTECWWGRIPTQTRTHYAAPYTYCTCPSVRPSVRCFVWMSYHCVSYFLARCNSVDFDRRLMSSGFRWSVAWPAFVVIITDNLLMSYGCQFYAAFKKYSDRINTRYVAEICGNVHSMEWA